jgi:hypothetical protein
MLHAHVKYVNLTHYEEQENYKLALAISGLAKKVIVEDRKYVPTGGLSFQRCHRTVSSRSS